MAAARDANGRASVQRYMKRLLLSVSTVALLTSAAASCRGDLAPVDPANLNGTWAEPNEIPGSSSVWTLVVAGTVVTGTGTWSGEACCGGTFAISGSITNGEVALDVIESTTTPVVSIPPSHFRFEGPVPTADVLQGVITSDDGKTSIARLVRQ